MNSLLDNHNKTSLKTANILRNKLNNSISEVSSSFQNADTSSLTEKDISIGMSVLFKPLNTIATVLTLPNKSKDIQIQIGNAKMNANINNLGKTKMPTDSNQNDTSRHSHVRKDFNLKSKTVSTEINVIGMNIEESIFVIDKYLDDCSIANISPVRIVHGKGTGKLRDGIHTFLKTNKHVKTFRLGTFGEGEMGVTVVEII